MAIDIKRKELLIVLLVELIKMKIYLSKLSNKTFKEGENAES